MGQKGATPAAGAATLARLVRRTGLAAVNDEAVQQREHDEGVAGAEPDVDALDVADERQHLHHEHIQSLDAGEQEQRHHNLGIETGMKICRHVAGVHLMQSMFPRESTAPLTSCVQ